MSLIFGATKVSDGLVSCQTRDGEVFRLKPPFPEAEEFQTVFVFASGTWDLTFRRAVSSYYEVAGRRRGP